jgi:maltose alpha-D-glucosyltransferase/alpha-amylase
MDVQLDAIPAAEDLVQTYLEEVRLVGRRLAEMHLALASDAADPAFAPEAFTSFDMRGRFHSLAGLLKSVMQLLRERQPHLGRGAEADASDALGFEKRIGEIFSDAPPAESAGLRTRIHGDLHLGQILHTGDDLVFIDFEGDNSLPLRERVLKRSPLVDLGSILLSLRYAATSALASKAVGLYNWRARPMELERWVRFWLAATTSTCLNAYRGTLGDSPLVPVACEDFRRLLDMHLTAKAVYQVGYDLQNRRDWIGVALRALREVVSEVRQKP